MVLYEYDNNAILTESINNRTAGELLRAFQVMGEEIDRKRPSTKTHEIGQ
jgi:hypothetical protein